MEVNRTEPYPSLSLPCPCIHAIVYPSKSADSSLGGNIGCSSGLADVTDEAGDVDDVALRLPQMRQRILARREVAEHWIRCL
jgi:hypothetical protein